MSGRKGRDLMGKATQLTKAGNPKLGTTIEVMCDDGWEQVKFVAYGFGVGAQRHTVVMGIIEFDDGSRSEMLAWPTVTWRPIPKAGAGFSRD